ncbi:putative Protein YIF1B [Nannochloris sp. 'desiccata']|nr:putative Protein YIF1B [Chlorella desiccata (nom. nud.)]
MANQYSNYGQHPWAAQQQNIQQPGFFVPQATSNPTAFGDGGFAGAADPFLSGMAGNVLRQQGQTYLQRSQAFMQSKMGFLSGGLMQYLFAVTPEYVRSKLFLLVFPFLKKYNYVRVPEQLSGGHKYLPPRQDVNAPDLYIPVMALWTYCLLVGIALFGSETFKPEILYNTVSTAIGAWAVHTVMLKVVLWMLGIGSTAALLELAAYAGYPFVAACIILVANLTLGSLGYHVVWAYGGLCMAVFLVRTMKRVIFSESSQYSHQASRHNYLLLGLATFQFPFLAWLSRVPSS